MAWDIVVLLVVVAYKIAGMHIANDNPRTIFGAGRDRLADCFQSRRGRKHSKAMQLNLRISLDFATYSDADLDEFASNVVASLTGNAAFPTPPVTPADLGALNATFHDALVAAMPGGIQLTAAKKAARIELIDALRKESNYVQTHARKNLDVLLTSGFYANSTNRAQSPLEQPAILRVENAGTTKLLVRMTPVTNAKSYHVQISTAVNVWQDAGIFTQARRIVLGNLTPGTTYSIRTRAIGGSTGSSEWSNPVSLMAT